MAPAWLDVTRPQADVGVLEGERVALGGSGWTRRSVRGKGRRTEGPATQGPGTVSAERTAGWAPLTTAAPDSGPQPTGRSAQPHPPGVLSRAQQMRDRRTAAQGSPGRQAEQCGGRGRGARRCARRNETLNVSACPPPPLDICGEPLRGAQEASGGGPSRPFWPACPRPGVGL